MFKVKSENGFKYTGRSRAIVIDNRDPDNLGRIRVDHPVLGETTWIDYLNVPGQFSIPSIGDIVYVEPDSGNPMYPICWGNLSKIENNKLVVPTEFIRDIPTNRGIYTPNGHLLELDDGEAEITNKPEDTKFTTKGRGIRLTSTAGNKIHITEDSDNGIEEIIIQDVKGNEIKLDYKNEVLSIVAKKDQEQTIENNWTVTVNGNTVIKSGDVKVDSPKSTLTGDLIVNGKGQVDGNLDAKADLTVTGATTLKSTLDVTGASTLGGSLPLLLSSAVFIGVGNLGLPVISSVMTGLTTKVTGS